MRIYEIDRRSRKSVGILRRWRNSDRPIHQINRARLQRRRAERPLSMFRLICRKSRTLSQPILNRYLRDLGHFWSERNNKIRSGFIKLLCAVDDQSDIGVVLSNDIILPEMMKWLLNFYTSKR